MKTDELEKTKPKKKKDFQVRIPRLIVRNLDFKVKISIRFDSFGRFSSFDQVKEDRLKKVFEENTFATINAATIVSRGKRNRSIFENERRRCSSDGQSKGFGFVTFDKLEEAQKAIETMNGKKILGEFESLPPSPHREHFLRRSTDGGGLVIAEEYLPKDAPQWYLLS